jgi:uncharacterized membrane protein
MNTSPEHIHAVINHVPLFAAGFALIPLLFAIAKKSSIPLQIGLLFLIIGAACMVPTILTGESAEHRVEALVDPQGKSWAELHEHRSEPLAVAFYIVGGLALIALVAARRVANKATRPIAIGFLIAAATLFVWVAYVADSGGKVRHSEFRAGAATVPATGEPDD